jgi:phospholipase C
VRDGQALIASIYNALAQSPQWQRSLFVVTYDEHGGFYDHVPPPLTEDDDPEFRQLGFRVPSLVVGPQVRADIVDTQLDHVSVISTLTRKFGLAPLTRRVEATNDLSSCIDPEAVSRPRAPVELPKIATRRDIGRPLERQKLGGQYELAWLVERQLRADWRWHADRARRSLHANGNRLGALNLF